MQTLSLSAMGVACKTKQLSVSTIIVRYFLSIINMTHTYIVKNTVTTGVPRLFLTAVSHSSALVLWLVHSTDQLIRGRGTCSFASHTLAKASQTPVRAWLAKLQLLAQAAETPVSVVTKLQVDYLNRERYAAALLAKNIDDTKHERWTQMCGYLFYTLGVHSVP